MNPAVGVNYPTRYSLYKAVYGVTQVLLGCQHGREQDEQHHRELRGEGKGHELL